MIRGDLPVLALVVASALGVVAAQHQARKLFVELERENARAQSLEVEWGQLQLEQSTWAAHARVEKIARERIGMRAPSPGQMIVVDVSSVGTAVAPATAPRSDRRDGQ